jgi:polyisoprenoid-binding protein YceI
MPAPETAGPWEAPVAITTWNIDTSHADVQFSAKHMMVTTVRGKFGGVTGTLTLDEENPANSGGTITVDASTVNSNFEARDNHLKSPDFFDVATYPSITFTATKVEPAGASDYRITGDLTIRDVTRSVTLDVEYLGTYQGFGPARRAGFHARTKILREDWGLTWNMALESGAWLVGKEITLEIDLAVEEAAAVVAEASEAESAA